MKLRSGRVYNVTSEKKTNVYNKKPSQAVVSNTETPNMTTVRRSKRSKTSTKFYSL